MHDELRTLCAKVQKNCHISDARYAGDYTLCIYLLKMREYYRWEKGFSLDASLSKDAVGSWLNEREQLWDALADEGFETLPVKADTLDPFETDTINASLIPAGLVYSGGLGRNAKPHFLLARLERHERYDDFTVLVSAEEYARDLSAPPAMTLGNTVFIRRDSLRRLLWEKTEEWRWARHDNAMGRAVQCYGFDTDPLGALERMTDREIEAVLLHEIGEVMAGQQLGGEWDEMLAALPRSRAEIAARAVRDHLADALSTLPALLDQGDAASLHFYFGNLSSMRKVIFPRLSGAYDTWVGNADIGALRDLIPESREHWLTLGRRMIEAYSTHGADCLPHVDSLIDAGHL
ncbi:MAG: Sfum_1244 family protein [Gammaproteobacteria bacterium]